MDRQADSEATGHNQQVSGDPVRVAGAAPARSKTDRHGGATGESNNPARG